MGKPFAEELKQLEGTYKWARGANIGKIKANSDEFLLVAPSERRFRGIVFSC